MDETIIVEKRAWIGRLVQENAGFCPCIIEQNEDSICPCRDFRELPEGECQCGRYVKVKVKGEKREGNHEKVFESRRG